MVPNQLWISDTTYLPTRQGTGFEPDHRCLFPAYYRPTRPRQPAYHRLPICAEAGRARDRPGRRLAHSPLRPGQAIRLGCLSGGTGQGQTALLNDRRLRLLPKRAGRADQRDFERRVPRYPPRRPSLGPLAGRSSRIHLQQDAAALSLQLLNPLSNPCARKRPRRKVRARPLSYSYQHTAGRDISLICNN